MRTINRHNYEEFFLLYADDELSVAEKQTVEQFVAENTDLIAEFTLFLQMQLPIETILFDDKDSLHRNETAEINLHNYEELFLRYVDNELTSTTKNTVETFVLQQPDLQENFTLLKQTRLIPETIVFPYKQSLYRKEEKEKPLVYLHWTRIAVAAVFMGVGVLVWILVQNNNEAPRQIAKLNPASIVPQQPGPATISKTENNSSPQKKEINSELVRINNDTPEKSMNRSSQKIKQLDNSDHTIAFNKTLPAETKSNPVTIVETVSTVGIQSNNTLVLPERNTSLLNDVIASSVDNEVPIIAANNTALPIVYKELDTEDEKKSLYLGSIEINKDKLRGFLRKAGSFFRTKDKQPEDEKSDAVPVSNTRLLK